jgi:hypothetical protein
MIVKCGSLTLAAARRFGLICALALLAFGSGGCTSLPALTPVDLTESGWTVKQGEGLWSAKHNAPAISGEILIATRAGGDSFVAYTKTPFAMVLAQQQTDSWQIESPARHKRHSGRGKAPGWIIWLQLPGIAQGGEPPRGWTLNRENSEHWRLERNANGESVEVWLAEGSW